MGFKRAQERFTWVQVGVLLLITNMLSAYTVHNMLKSQRSNLQPIIIAPVSTDKVASLAVPSTSSLPDVSSLSTAVEVKRPTDADSYRELPVAGNSHRNRVYCMVPASGTPAQLRNGVRALDFVLATWGPRCDVIKFFVEADPNLPATYLPNNARSADIFKTGVENPGEKGAPLVGIEMQRSGCNDRGKHECRNIWEKVWRSWAWVWKHDLGAAEWYLKVDPDTYLFVNNLKDFLRPLDPEQKLYLGHNVYQHVPKGGPIFNQGGASVFSHATIDVMGAKFQNMESRFGAKHVWSTECVDRDGAQEEWGTAICLRHLNITATDTADEQHRERFIPFQLQSHLRLLRKDGPDGWYWQGKPDHAGDGVNCCADDLIALHSYKAESFQDISRWFEYEHFERGYQNLKKRLDSANEDLRAYKSLNQIGS